MNSVAYWSNTKKNRFGHFFSTVVFIEGFVDHWSRQTPSLGATFKIVACVDLQPSVDDADLDGGSLFRDQLRWSAFHVTFRALSLPNHAWKIARHTW